MAVEARSLSPFSRLISRSAARLRPRPQEPLEDTELHLRQRPISRVYTNSISSRCSSCSSFTRDSSSLCCTTTTMLTVLTPASALLRVRLLRVRLLLLSGQDLRQDFHHLLLTLIQILLKSELLLHLNPRLHLHLRPKAPPRHQHTPLTPTTIHTPPLPVLKVQQQTQKRRPPTCPLCLSRQEPSFTSLTHSIST